MGRQEAGRMSRIISIFVSILLLTTMAGAQRGPNITRVIHNGTRALTTGEQLDVIILGESGCTARFEILGAIRSVSMTEVQSGRYEARYTIPPGLEVDRGIVIGYLSRGGFESVLEATKPVTVKMGQGNTNQAPSITTSPKDGGRTGQTRPNVVANFPVGLQPNRIKFYVDGIDFSRQVRLSNRNKTLNWKPSYDLTRAKHDVEIQGIDLRGAQVSHKWTFTVGKGKTKEIVKTYSPAKSSTVTTARPTIGATFKGQLQSPRLYVDNKDFTGAARYSNSQIYWTPNYDLSPGEHTAKVVAYNKKGREVSQTWKFTIGQAATSIQSISYSPTRLRVGQILTVNAKATPGSNLTFDLGNKRRGIALKESGNTGNYTGQYTIVSGDAGAHSIIGRIQLPDGRTLTKVANNQLVIEDSALTVDNIREGAGVPTNFNVQGGAPAGAQITVTTEFGKKDFLGTLSGQTKKLNYTGVAGANKRFDVPVHIGIKQGQQFRLTVSDNMGSKPLVFNLVKQ